MPPAAAIEAVRGRPEALDDLARTAGEVGGRWRARSVLLLDAMDSAAIAELRGLRIDTSPARRLASIGTQLVEAGHAIGAFSRALRSVDHLVDRHGVTAASQASVTRWMLAHGHDTDLVVVEILQRLPDGQRRSLEDFEQMSASERMAWMDAFVATSGDRRHRAITSVLAYLADSPSIRGDDRSVFGDSWWSVADAAVLLVIQDGWLRHQGLATPADRPFAAADPLTEAYEGAVTAWADHNAAIESADLSDEATLRSWVRAEQAGVEFGELTAEYTWRRDPWFVAPNAAEWDAITSLVPGTHTFRLSVLAETEREYLLSIVDEIIAHAIGATIIDPDGLYATVPGLGLAHPRLLEDGGRSIADLGGSWTDNWGFGAATNLFGGALRGFGAAHRLAAETATATVDFVATEAARAMADGIEQFTPDALEREIARGMLDPTIVPPAPLRQVFDLWLGTDRAEEELSFAYYFAVMMEAGWLPPLPGYWIDDDGQRRHVRPPVQAGPLRDD